MYFVWFYNDCLEYVCMYVCAFYKIIIINRRNNDIAMKLGKTI